MVSPSDPFVLDNCISVKDAAEYGGVYKSGLFGENLRKSFEAQRLNDHRLVRYSEYY
jgi:hypothetical protein